MAFSNIHSKPIQIMKAVHEVMAQINMDIRKTEGQLAMSAIFNDIDCCLPHLISV